jgi:GNAT superfamily N-acetyltransferase
LTPAVRVAHKAQVSLSFHIRSLSAGDHDAWSRLWRGYLKFYETDLPEPVSDMTWRRLLDPEAPLHGLCADEGNGRLLGIVHYLFHPVTWAIGPRCYLEDLFTDEAARGRGVGRALIEAVYKAADARGADQVYWLTASTNTQAQALYDQVATRTAFIKYRR